MKTYEGTDSSGKLAFFEVGNLFLTRRTAIKIIKSIPNVRVVIEDLRSDIFCEFKINEKHFQIMEPFGDNSRYHISERKAQLSVELCLVRDSFSARKTILQKILNR